MISVQNLQQQLNGSKYLLFFSAMLFLQSCGLFSSKIAQGDLSTTPVESKEKDSSKIIVEEVVIEPVDEKTAKDGSLINEAEYPKKDYHLALVLPFDASAPSIDDAHSLVINYYEGFKSGLYAADLGDMKLTVDIYDSKARDFSFSKLSSDLKHKNTDLIIGGLMKQSIQMLSKIALEDSIPFVSPLYPTNDIVHDNPYHIQVNPGLEAHLSRLRKHILSHHPDTKILVVGRNTSSERIRVGQILEDFQSELLDTSITKVDSILINWSNENSDFSFSNHLKNFQKHIFLIPSWSSETFIYHVLRQLSIDKQEAEVLVFGMPQWKSFELISPEYLEKLQVHISAGSYIDDPEVEKTLKRRIFDKYNDVPSNKEALAYAVGADVGEYFTEMLARKQALIESIQEVKYYGKAVHFAFPGNAGQEAMPRDLLQKPQRLENYGVKLLKFTDWQYKIVE